MKKVKLGEIGKILTGCTPSTKKSEYYESNDYMFVGPSDIKNVMYVVSSEKHISQKAYEDHKTRFINENSIVVDCIGSDMGNVAIVKENCLTNQQINAITNIDKNKFNIRYIYYVLSTMKNYFHLIGTNGSTMPILNKSMFENIEIEVPDIEIQNKIANILSKLDDKIKLNNEINNNLQELEKNLYKEFFKKLSDDNTQKLGDLCKIKYGKGLPTTKIETDGYPVYGGNGIIGYYHEFMYEDSQVLVSCRGAASGNVIVSKPKSFVTNNSLILECDRKYHHYLKQYSLDNYYYEYTTGSAQPQITIDNIKAIILKIPSDDVLDKYNNQMETLEKQYFCNLEEMSKLEKLRDTLLPKLMNGEIDLDNIEV